MIHKKRTCLCKSGTIFAHDGLDDAAASRRGQEPK
jgi:hypothetical protein